MKLSKGTLDILKNFSNINPSITFKEGQELSTLSSSSAASDVYKRQRTYRKSI